MEKTKPPNKKEQLVRKSLNRSLEYLKCSKDKIQVNHRHGLCRGMARAYFDLGYLQSPDYRKYLWEINQTASELNQLLPEKYELYK